MFNDGLALSGTQKKLSFGAAAALLLSPQARAQETGPVSIDAYRNELDVQREEAWLLREIRELRSQPYLERAYRFMDGQHWLEARHELEEYLSISPQDLQVRSTLLTVLERLNDHAATITQANEILNERPEFVPALIYRGLAHQARKEFTEAIADLDKAAHSPTVRPDDRRMALNLAIELSLQEQLYAQTLTALDQLGADDKNYHWYFRQGVALAGVGRFAEAKEAYREAFRIAPNLGDRAKASQAIGEIAKNLQDWEEARQAFTTAHDLDPGDTQLMRTLAEIADNRRDYKEAADWMRRAVSTKPKVEDRIFLANSLYALRDYRGAILELTALLPEVHEKEERYRTYLALGHAYTQLKEYRKAADAFQEAAGITADLNTLLTLAQVREKNGQIGMAIASLEQALPQNPSAELHYRLGKLNLKRGARVDALRHFEEALHNSMPEGTGQHYRLQMDLGTSLAGLKQYELAAQAFRDALATSNTLDARLALGQVYENTGKLQDAITVLGEASDQQPQAETRLRLSALYARVGNHDAAMLELREAASERAPVRVRVKALQLQGRLYLKRNDSAAAHDSFAAALALRPRSAELLAELGGADIKLHKYQEATKHLQLSLGIRQSTTALRNLGLAHMRLNQWEKAAAVNRRLLSLERFGPTLRRETLANLRLINRHVGGAAPAFVRPSDHAGAAADLMAHGRWDDALDELVRVSKHESKATILRDIARCYEELHKPHLAIDYLNKALVHKQQLSKIEQQALHKRLGHLYDEVQDRQLAAQHYDLALRLKPEPEIALRLGRAQRLQGKDYHARQNLEGIAPGSLSPTLEAQRQDELAEVYLRQRQAKQAISALKQANKLAPAAEREYKLGQLHWQHGESEQAMLHFRAAYVRDFKNNDYIVALANAYHATGRHKDAARLFKLVVDRDPKHRGIIRQMDNAR